MLLKIINTADGSNTLINEKLGDTYHSKFGAIGESMHIFIKNGLYKVSSAGTTINILEIGFGTGLNAFLTLREALALKINVAYTSFEPYPLDHDLIKQLNYSEIIESGRYKNEFLLLHQTDWNKEISISPYFTLNKIDKKFMEFKLPDDQFHLVYFDAFAPDIQPELWTEDVFKNCFVSMKNNSVLITYSAKGSVKRALKSTGFIIENIKGPTGKREITKAVKMI
jgi:tRNA U34 5-methylaminomethyl-2-thiouridine-forming methyltransferase MnmC